MLSIATCISQPSWGQLKDQLNGQLIHVSFGLGSVLDALLHATSDEDEGDEADEDKGDTADDLRMAIGPVEGLESARYSIGTPHSPDPVRQRCAIEHPVGQSTLICDLWFASLPHNSSELAIFMDGHVDLKQHMTGVEHTRACGMGSQFLNDQDGADKKQWEDGQVADSLVHLCVEVSFGQGFFSALKIDAVQPQKQTSLESRHWELGRTCSGDSGITGGCLLHSGGAPNLQVSQ